MTSIAIDLGQNSLSNNFGIMFFFFSEYVSSKMGGIGNVCVSIVLRNTYAL